MTLNLSPSESARSRSLHRLVERSRWRGGVTKIWPFGHGVRFHRVRSRAGVLDLLARALAGVSGQVNLNLNY